MEREKYKGIKETMKTLKLTKQQNALKNFNYLICKPLHKNELSLTKAGEKSNEPFY